MLYELPIFEHIEVKSIEEALSWLQRFKEKARVIAGGTDLLSLMKDRIRGPQLQIPDMLINIKSIPTMNRIVEEEENGLRIGAAVTLNHLESSEMVQKRFSILSQAVRQIGTTQIRHMGTIGGNICQRPRCLYFRHPDFLCYKKGGERCYALTGEHRYYHSIINYGKCVMAHPSDLAPVLIALNAKAILTTSAGERQIPLQNFLESPSYFKETVLEFDELLSGIRVPAPRGGTYQRFLKQRIRHSVDFALSSVAAVVRISQGICEDFRIVLGGIAPLPFNASEAEEIMRGRKLGDKIISKAAEAAVGGAKPLPLNRYKVDLSRALVRRVLTSIWQETVKES